MLPEIAVVAKEYGLLEAPRQRGKELRFKCPFCREDEHNEKGKYYLSVNPYDQVFFCWFCKETGGVLRFIALLSDVSEDEVISRYRRRKINHPAERLSRFQRGLVGGTEPDFHKMRERDRAYYFRTLDFLWKEWNQFLEQEIQDAYRELLTGILTQKYSGSIERIRKREKEIGASLVTEVLNIYSCAERPEWAVQAETCIGSYLKSLISPDLQAAGKE